MLADITSDQLLVWLRVEVKEMEISSRNAKQAGNLIQGQNS